MKEYYYVAYMGYVILGVGSTAFSVWVLPALILTIADAVRHEAKIFYNGIYNSIDTFLIELKEHFEFLEQEKGRHRRLGDEDLFQKMLLEIREVNEGKRMPVPLNG